MIASHVNVLFYINSNCLVNIPLTLKKVKDLLLVSEQFFLLFLIDLLQKPSS